MIAALHEPVADMGHGGGGLVAVDREPHHLRACPRQSAAIWRVVASMSAVSVLVIDWTTIGAPPPTVTAASPSPTRTPTVAWRESGPQGVSDIARLIAVIPFPAALRPK